MAEYLLVESQGRYAGPGSRDFLGDAERLAASGHTVTVLLIENGVTDGVGTGAGTGAGTGSDAVERLLEAGVRVWADGFSLEQRALAALLRPGVRRVGMDEVAEQLLRPAVQGVWH
ncbi:hypothetical protein GCM10010387_32510 [Streptomyces inusitatus]|uniref:DsrE family protein n=1 Tax=Streptomyces inusitatus TaxID=68221 RepID=A0A918Q8T4_9ACTN|nr:DsrE family protein [Streptomyces inusitatus]GGZ35815.1 hypothetical protein GCM10010387_32510 [Streptomyces inusitatus]